MKRSLFLLAAVVGLSALALPTAPVRVAHAQTGIDPNQWYNIVAKHSGKCLDVAGGGLNAGARLIQYDCHLGDNQKFRFSPVGNGTYNIIAGNSGLCIDQVNATYTNGGQFMQWYCHSGLNQQFQLINGQVGTGYYNQIRVQHSYKNMDVANYSFSNGAYIIQYDPHGADNQQFELRPVTVVPCAGRDADGDGVVACYDCDDNDPNIQECPPPCDYCE